MCIYIQICVYVTRNVPIAGIGKSLQNSLKKGWKFSSDCVIRIMMVANSRITLLKNILTKLKKGKYI